MSSNETPAPESQPTVIDKVKQMVGMEPAPTAPQSITKFRRIHMIVNPSAGQIGLNLRQLNKDFNELGVEWEMFVTRKGGEAGELGRKAVAAGVDAIVVYGGDGTVLEVASNIAGSDIPLVIIPGGTANVLSVELGIPGDQTQATMLLGGAPNAIRPLDMGALANGNKGGKKGNAGDSELMFFHLGIGMEGTMHEQADREAKDRSGMFAYVTAALKTLSNPTMAHYRMTLDGETVEVDGINCMVTNFGNIGVPGITLSHDIDVGDGLLDVIVFQDAHLTTLLAAAASAVTSGGELAQAQPLLQWQARDITIEADPPQTVVVDGELIEIDAVQVRVMPQVVRVVVPAPATP